MYGQRRDGSGGGGGGGGAGFLWAGLAVLLRRRGVLPTGDGGAMLSTYGLLLPARFFVLSFPVSYSQLLLPSFVLVVGSLC